MSHEYTSLRYEKSDGIAHITFSRPDKHNALDLAQVQDLEAVTASIAADPEVRCILVDAEGTFAPVVFFTHALGAEEAKAQFVALSLETGHVLRATRDHLVPVGTGKLVPAKEVKAGDVVKLADGRSAVVVSATLEWGGGLFNPHTGDDTIVVDGVVASQYTLAFSPKIANVLLAPVRGLRNVRDMFRY